MRSRICLVGRHDSLDIACWRIAPRTPSNIVYRLLWMIGGIPWPPLADPYVSEYDRNFFWLVQQNALEHVAIILQWQQVDTDAVEFVLRLLMSVSVFRRRTAALARQPARIGEEA